MTLGGIIAPVLRSGSNLLNGVFEGLHRVVEKLQARRPAVIEFRYTIIHVG